MKKNQKLLPFIFIIISFVAFFSMNSCGQQESTVNADPIINPAKEEIPTAISQDSVNTNPDQTIPTDKTQNIITTDPKKELPPIDKKKVSEPDKKFPPEKPVTQPVKTPEEKPTEPVKPVPIPKPDPIEVPKPDPVQKPDPVIIKEPVQNSWVVPAKYLSMTNPFPVNSESIALGKSLYTTHCRSCHGSKGAGDGTKAASIDTKIRSFLSAGFLAQKQGEVYYKSIVGRKDMPKFEKKIPDQEDQWAIVHYIMNLKN